MPKKSLEKSFLNSVYNNGIKMLEISNEYNNKKKQKCY